MEQTENRYEDVIARYTDTQLIYEQAILNEEETILYNKKKALKEELKKRLRTTNRKEKISE